MVLYSPDWTNTGFSFILLTVNLFRHPTLIEHRHYSYHGSTGLENKNYQNEIVNIVLPIIYSICLGCSKESSHSDSSFCVPTTYVLIEK